MKDFMLENELTYCVGPLIGTEAKDSPAPRFLFVQKRLASRS